MAPDLVDHEARLRLVETKLEKLGWVVDGHDRLIPKIVEQCDVLDRWHRDERRHEWEREAGLTRREKWIGLGAVVLAPFVSAIIQHVLK